ncbi:PINIT domain-containing protein [Cokeromyces recurvatus]|uniref:PINIT domain-containing protein n=1 Tax=Cokeromyces recurvatus TaxID=90255 RepID=UPI00221FFC8D|nr:PINIT domain-containing protein [Cokeromyces recurvatus]KAI7899506.1 PINIT domain-containing protein [Cokeromyces recurvatus]
MSTTANLETVQNSLKIATVKEINDCIKELNKSLNTRSKLSMSGRKEEKINRVSNFITALINNKNRTALANLVSIVNKSAPNKFHWQLNGDEVIINNVFAKPTAEINKKLALSEDLSFHPSPFLKPIERLTSVKICPASVDERKSKLFQFVLTDVNRQLLSTPNTVDNRPPIQIRFYCSKYTGSYSNLLVEFPPVCELRVNDGVIQGNHLRCLKGKPGTVNPPDLSVMMRKQAINNVELVYINSDTPYIASIYIVERTPVPTLIDIMKEKRFVTKEKILEKLQQTQEDAEIIMESETLSTKDPLAFSRIVTPIRSNKCQHLQCFDASIYLIMNEQTPTWTCPVCYRRIESWEDLFVDGYFTEMLKNTPKHVDSVRVEPNGHITIIDEDPALANDSDDDNDEEESRLLRNVKNEEKEVTTILLDDDDEEEGEEENVQQLNNDNNTTNANGTTAVEKRIEREQSSSNSSSNDDQHISSVNHNTITETTPKYGDNIPISISSYKPNTTTNNSNNSKEGEPIRKKQKTTEVIDLTLDSDDDIVEEVQQSNIR